MVVQKVVQIYFNMYVLYSNTEKIKLLKAVNSNTIIEIIGRVEKVKWVRVYVTVEMYAEEYMIPIVKRSWKAPLFLLLWMINRSRNNLIV